MKLKNKIPIILILFAMIFASCEKIIEANLEDSHRRIVVNSTFTADSILEVNISKSLHVLDNSNVMYLNNAVVKLYENDQLVDTLQNIGNGDYTSTSFVPAYGKTYKLMVSSANLDDVEGQNKIPVPVEISNIDTMKIKREQEERMECKISINDPAGTDNYYLLQIYRYLDYYNGPVYKGDIKNFSTVYFNSDDPVIEEWVNWGEGAIFSDDIFNGNSYKINIDVYIGDIVSYDSTGVTLYYYLNSISREYYLYLLSLAKYQNTNSDFFAEPVRVYSNITNGLGIFAGYSSAVDSILFESYKDPYYYEW